MFSYSKNGYTVNDACNSVSKKRSGASVPSVILGLIIIAGGFSALYGQYLRADEGQKVADFVSQMTEFPATVSGMYSAQRNFSGLSSTIMINSGGVPEQWINATGDGIIHTAGGAIELAAASTSTPAFVARFSDLPQAMCRKMVASGLGASGFQAGDSASGTIDTSTIGPTAAATLCTSDNVDVTATFRKS